LQVSWTAARIADLRTYYRQPANMLALAWTVLVAVGLLVGFQERGFDDPYITYRYAANIANGTGFVYNSGERVLSTTTPLYALLLACGDWLGVSVPLLSNTLGCIGLAIGGLIFWRLGQVWQTSVVGIVGLLLYPTSLLLIGTLGAETIFLLTLLLAAFLSIETKHYYLAAVLFALATLTRADSLVAVAAAAIYVLVVHAQGQFSKLPWRAAGIYGLLLLPWILFAGVYFGSPLPVTLAAKQQQGAMDISQSFSAGLKNLVIQYWHIQPFQLHMILALLGIAGLAFYAPRWWLLVGWNIGYAIAYSLLNVTSYFWYYAPLVIGFVTLVGMGVTRLLSLMQRIVRSSRTVASVGGVLIACLLLLQLVMLYNVRNQSDVRLDMYQTIGEWLQTSTPAGASVATLEVGVIGYYAQRPMIDFAGLLQPETALRFSPSTTYDDAAVWATHTFQPDYIVLQDGTLRQLQQDPDVQASCQNVQVFHGSHFARPFIVYHCSW
jgi:hypothetical protein